MSKYRIIDLFSGIGGFRIAFSNHGCSCVFSSDIDKLARETYFNNFGEMPSGDITKINENDVPDHDILTGGFPCQSFSIAGKRLGFDDARGTLFFDVARIIKAKQPKAFLLENVSGLISHDSGNTIKTIESILQDLGYTFSWSLLNAKDYGVPQNRNRWYCIGIRNDIAKNINLDKKKLHKMVFPDKRKLSYGLKDIIDTKSSYPEYSVTKRAKENIEKRISDFRDSDRYDQKNYIIANNVRPSKVSYSSSDISPCLTAKMGTGGNNVPIVVELSRKLTETECLKIMGFPTWYKIKPNNSQSYKQIGNSVVVPVLDILAGNIVKILDNFDSNMP